MGYKLLLNGSQVATTFSNNYDFGRLSPSTGYTISVVAYNDNYAESAAATSTSTTLDADAYASDLQFTKYIEGTGYNKALEIINNTGYDVDLKKYRVAEQAFNGKTYYFTGSYELEGFLKKGQKLTLINNKASLSGFDMGTADVKTNANPLNYSGSQYVELNYETSPKVTQTVDAIGYYNQSTDYAKDVTLYRNADVLNPNTKFTTSEWTQYPTDYYAGLGTLGTQEATAADTYALYPNPVAEGMLYVSGRSIAKISKAEIIDISGRAVRTVQRPFASGNSIAVQDLPAGLYLLKLDGQVLKFIKK